MTACIRKPGAVWTSCTCDDCRPISARNTKLYRNNRRPVLDRRPAAGRRLQVWASRGYSSGAIATMCGLSERTIAPLVDGRVNPSAMFHATAAAILSAPDEPTGGGWVPAIGSTRRLRALTVTGWSMQHLGDRAGVEPTTLAAIRSGKYPNTRPKFARAVSELYDALWSTPGPGRKAATRARNRGWAPPLAWDDETIDDPTAEPNTGEKVAWERFSIDALDDCASWGMDRHQAADRLKVDVSAIEHRCRRNGRLDLLERLDRNALAREAS